jgi:hypothetical protein
MWSRIDIQQFSNFLFCRFDWPSPHRCWRFQGPGVRRPGQASNFTIGGCKEGLTLNAQREYTWATRQHCRRALLSARRHQLDNLREIPVWRGRIKIKEKNQRRSRSYVSINSLCDLFVYRFCTAGGSYPWTRES